MSAPRRGRLPVPADPAAMLGHRSARRAQLPMRRPSEIHIVEEAREPPPAGPRIPGEPRARERERRRRTYRVRDDARGPDRSGTRRLRPGTLNRTATAPHVGATPPVLSPRSPTSRSLASSEGSSPYEPGRPRRGRRRRDHQRRPTRRTTHHEPPDSSERAATQTAATVIGRRGNRDRNRSPPDGVGAEAAADDQERRRCRRADRPVPMEPSIPMDDGATVSDRNHRGSGGRRQQRRPGARPRPARSVDSDATTADDRHRPETATPPRATRPHGLERRPRPRPPSPEASTSVDRCIRVADGAPKRRRRRGGRGRGGGGRGADGATEHDRAARTARQPTTTEAATDIGATEPIAPRPRVTSGRGPSRRRPPASTGRPGEPPSTWVPTTRRRRDSTADTQRDDAIPDGPRGRRRPALASAVVGGARGPPSGRRARPRRDRPLEPATERGRRAGPAPGRTRSRSRTVARRGGCVRAVHGRVAWEADVAAARTPSWCPGSPTRSW